MAIRRRKAILIGFSGPMQVGKTTAARFLERKYGFVVLSFSTPVKQIAMEFFGWDGAKDERGRRLLQALGTEAGRAYDPDIWVRYAAKELGQCVGRDVCFDDVRFENEAELIRSRGGVIVRIIRQTGLSSDHPSEQIDLKPDFVIENSRDYRYLYTQLDGLIRHLTGMSRTDIQEQGHATTLSDLRSR